MRDEFSSYALLQDMLYKLRLNEHKGHWEERPVATLLRLLKDEVAELEEALLNKAPSFEVGYEAADVACYAMMLADNVGAYRERKYARMLSSGVELSKPLAEDVFRLIRDISSGNPCNDVQHRARKILVRLWE